MRYPKLLKPDGTEAIKLPSGNIMDVPKTRPQFQVWSGEPILDTYGKKPVLDSDGLPAFAEIRILRLFQQDGWTGVWVDTFQRKLRTEFWPKNEIQLPRQEKELLENIYRRADDRKGCWDVFCWKGADHIWAESKLRGRDSIRDTQVKWLQAALECGLPLSSFLIVEWSLEKSVKSGKEKGISPILRRPADQKHRVFRSMIVEAALERFREIARDLGQRDEEI